MATISGEVPAALDALLGAAADTAAARAAMEMRTNVRMNSYLPDRFANSHIRQQEDAVDVRTISRSSDTGNYGLEGPLVMMLDQKARI